MTALRSCIAALCLALAALPGVAQPAQKFAVLCLIGDKFLVVNHVAQTGARVGLDRRTVIALPERAFDNTLAADVERAIKEAEPRASVVKLGGAKSLYPGDDADLDEPDPLALLAKVKPAIAPAGVTHVVLVTKLRREARIAMINTIQGQGKLEGLGFYMDPRLPTEDRDADQAGMGYLAAFAYFRVFLLDVASDKVIGYRDVTDTAPVTAGRSPSLQVWEALSSREKVQLVHELAQRGVENAVAKLLRGS